MICSRCPILLLRLRFEFFDVFLWVFVKRVAAARAADVVGLVFKSYGNLAKAAADGALFALLLAAQAFTFLVARYQIAAAVNFLARRLGLVPVVEADTITGHVHCDLLGFLLVGIGALQNQPAILQLSLENELLVLEVRRRQLVLLLCHEVTQFTAFEKLAVFHAH